jgi:pre-mRNA-splicing factor ATP-dependent RNA helicase DHX15/PRP43
MRPTNKQKEADRAKWLLSLPGGDHLTLLNAYNQYHQSSFFPSPTPRSRDVLCSGLLPTDINDSKWTWNNYLSKRNLVQADNVRSQLQRIMQRNNIPLLSNFSDPRSEAQLHENIRKALLTGFFMQVAHWDSEKKTYLTVKDVQPVQLHPSCDLEGNRIGLCLMSSC